jgi:serine/threonine protein kinase
MRQTITTHRRRPSWVYLPGGVEGREQTAPTGTQLTASEDALCGPSRPDRLPRLPRWIGRYQILGLLGRGGMGEVYRARDSSLGRDVALKLLPRGLASRPQRLFRFRQEARAIAALNHRNIVTLYSIESYDGLHFLTMELVEGETLADLTPPDGVPVAKLLQIAIPLAEALAAAHAAGIVHRDLKPTNVMVDREGRLKVVDFGLAKLNGCCLGSPPGRFHRGADRAPRHTTDAGALMGTVAYMSPEQRRGGGRVDQRSDIFSLGVLLYQMCTGRHPFHERAGATSRALRAGPWPLGRIRPDAPDRLERMVAKCLEKDPERRYQSAHDLCRDLRELRQEVTASALESELRRLRRRSRTDAGALAYSPTRAEPGARTARNVFVAFVGTVVVLGSIASSPLVHGSRSAGSAGPTVHTSYEARGAILSGALENRLDEIMRRSLQGGGTSGAAKGAPESRAGARGATPEGAVGAARDDVVLSWSLSVTGAQALATLEAVRSSTGETLWRTRWAGEPGSEDELVERVAQDIEAWLGELASGHQSTSPSRPSTEPS